MAGNYWKQLEIHVKGHTMDETVSKVVEMAGIRQHGLEIARKLMETDVHSWTWKEMNKNMIVRCLFPSLLAAALA